MMNLKSLTSIVVEGIQKIQNANRKSVLPNKEIIIITPRRTPISDNQYKKSKRFAW